MTSATRTSRDGTGRDVTIHVPDGIDLPSAHRHLQRVIDSLAARAGVQETLASAPAGVSPDMLAAIGRQDQEWRNLEQQYGMLTALEVAAAAGSKAANKAEYASQLRRDNKVLAVRRGRTYLYPAFQFRPDGRVHTAVTRVLAALTEQHWDTLSIAIWMNSPNGYLSGATPIERIVDTDAVVEAAVGAARIGD